MTKIGLEKASHKEREKLISLYDFYNKLNTVLNDDDYIDAITILDIIDSCPIKGYKAIN